MKVIVTGTTGFIGGGALERLLSLPQVTTVIALTRRELTIKHPKLETLIIKDFHHYSDDALSKFAGAEACIWALGTPTGGADVHDDLTFIGADAIAQAALPGLKADGKKFRFVYVSGHFVEPDQDKTLWFLPATRKLRGVVEHKIVAYQDKHAPQWETVVARPSIVTNGTPFYSPLLLGSWIPVKELSAALADVAVNGKVDDLRLSNEELRKQGQDALARQT